MQITYQCFEMFNVQELVREDFVQETVSGGKIYGKQPQCTTTAQEQLDLGKVIYHPQHLQLKQTMNWLLRNAGLIKQNNQKLINYVYYSFRQPLLGSNQKLFIVLQKKSVEYFFKQVYLFFLNCKTILYFLQNITLSISLIVSYYQYYLLLVICI